MGRRFSIFEPQPDKRFGHVHANYESVAGVYEAGWEWYKDQIRFYFQVPFDCRAEVGIKIPMKEIKVNGQSVSGMEMNQIYHKIGRIPPFLLGGGMNAAITIHRQL